MDNEIINHVRSQSDRMQDEIEIETDMNINQIYKSWVWFFHFVDIL